MQSVRAFTSPSLPCLTLSVLAACSTTYLDVPSRPDASDDVIAMQVSQPDLPSFGATTYTSDSGWTTEGSADSSARAGFRLVLATAAPAQPLYLYVDGQLISATPLTAPIAPEWGVSSGQLPDGSFGTIPSGFPDGPHTLALLKGDGQPVLDTRQNLAADAWNLLYVFGAPEGPSFDFVSDGLPVSSSVTQVRIVNLLDIQESLIVWTCDASNNCQKLNDDIAYGNSWSGELSTEVSALQFSWPSNLESGARGTCPLQSGRRDAVRHCVVLNGAQHFDGPGSL
jgi:hypothetical protein